MNPRIMPPLTSQRPTRLGVLGGRVAEPHIRVIPVNNGCIEFEGVSIPARPMIGVMGVAPSLDEGEWPTFTPWKHGGNLDTADLGEGSALFLQVRQKGALGDCHAIMGDGEVGCSGLEVAARVTMKVDLLKGKATVWPLLETSNHLMIIASGGTLEEATCSAIDEATKYLQRGLALSWEDAYILASLVVDVKISQVVNPKKQSAPLFPNHQSRHSGFCLGAVPGGRPLNNCTINVPLSQILRPRDSRDSDPSVFLDQVGAGKQKDIERYRQKQDGAEVPQVRV